MSRQFLSLRSKLALGSGLLLLAGACGTGKAPEAIDGGAVDCSAYDYSGTTYNCEELDRCTETDFQYRLGCCECDPLLCNPDPTCDDDDVKPTEDADSCMECHNGSNLNDYAGNGLSNPHPFNGSAYLTCSTCHGGNPEGQTKIDSHVPPPPAIGDDAFRINDNYAYFNRLTLTGLDKQPDYEVDGKTYSGIDYLQFVNPGDLRVVTEDRSCGASGCHGDHTDWVSRYPIATEVGFYSGTLFSMGVENGIPEHRGLFQDTAGDYGFRAVENPDYVYDAAKIGVVGKLLEFPEYAVWGDTTGIYQNPIYDVDNLANDIWTAAEDPEKTNRVKANTPLAKILFEGIAMVCGDCHLGSAGQNNRYGDFRSSGCTACHMEYSFDGRSRSTDPNVNKLEPANPDAIAAPERPHVDTHQIRNVAKVLPNGGFLRGISDKACVGCHQGSNRTVLQYWGVRLDQNQDLTNNTQYPANPVTFQDATGDTRFFDPGVNNATFNGRVAQQLIVEEDYDGDGRDDSPADVHYEAGMGCIDCHGTRDTHGGAKGDITSGQITSREDQAIGVECESCHGKADAYTATAECTDYAGTTTNCATDRLGNALRNVTRDGTGDFWLTSRLTGVRLYVPQTKDTIVNSNKAHPITGRQIYTPAASYAMGRHDGNALTGIGPTQTDATQIQTGFSHTDNMECVTCHASWTNNCFGCHTTVIYDDNPANYYFSNTTGERITVTFAAQFVYSNPVSFDMGVGSRGRITATQPGMKIFTTYQDLNGDASDVLAFSDRLGEGNNPAYGGRGVRGALGHNKIMPHSIRGRVSATDEGPRYCVACHLTTDALDNFGAEYAAFRDAMINNDMSAINYNLLQTHIGSNTGNQLNSPFYPHMAAGRGTALYLYDANGCPLNPLDANARAFCANNAPADNFDANTVNDDAIYDLDRVVEIGGQSNGSSKHPLLDPLGAGNLRNGANNPFIAGPMGGNRTEALTNPDTGIVLDSWLDADGQAQGDAANYIQ